MRSERRPRRPRSLVLGLALIVALLLAGPANAAKFKSFSEKDGLQSNTVTSIAIDANGTVWTGSIDGAAKFDGTVWTKYSRETGALPDNSVWSIDTLQGTDAVRVFLGTGSGLVVYDGRTFVTYSGRYISPTTGREIPGNAPLSSNAITKVLAVRGEDGKRDMVFLVARGKLYKFIPSEAKWSVFDFGNRLGDREITVLAAGGRGRLWLGTDGAGALEFDPAAMRLVRTTTKEGLPSDFVTAIYAAPDGAVYFGTDKGLALYKGGTTTVYNYKNSKLPSDFVTLVTKSAHGRVVIGTDTGLALHDGSNWVALPEGLTSFQGRAIWAAIAYDRPKLDFAQIWIGSRGVGVGVYEVSKDLALDQTEDFTRQGLGHLAAGRYNDAITAFEELKKIQSDKPEPYLYLARAMLGSGESIAKAEPLLKTAIDLAPNRKDLLITLGELYEKLEKPEEAEKIYRQLSDKYAQDVDGHVALGKLKLVRKDYDGAIEAYSRALAVDTELAVIYRGLAKAYRLKGDMKRALEVALQFQYKKPDDVENNLEVGRIFVVTNRLSEAEDEFKKILQVEATSAQAKAGLAFVYTQRGKNDEAKALLIEALKEDYKDPAAHANLALIFIESNDIGNGQGELNLAKSFNPTDPIVLFVSGRMLEAQGKYEESIRDYNYAMGGGLNNAEVHYRLATAQKSLENYEEALNEYQTVLQMDPNFKKAEDVKWMISKLSMPQLETASTGTETGSPPKPGKDGKPGEPGKPETGGLEELDF